MSADWVATPRLRWVERVAAESVGPPGTGPATARVLQCWHAPDVQGYMRDPNVGEWREVPVVVGEP